MRANGLQSALGGGRQSANGLEVLVGGPARRQSREGNRSRSHFGRIEAHCTLRRSKCTKKKGGARRKVDADKKVSRQRKKCAFLFFLPRPSARPRQSAAGGFGDQIECFEQPNGRKKVVDCISCEWNSLLSGLPLSIKICSTNYHCDSCDQQHPTPDKTPHPAKSATLETFVGGTPALYSIRFSPNLLFSQNGCLRPKCLSPTSPRHPCRFPKSVTSIIFATAQS